MAFSELDYHFTRRTEHAIGKHNQPVGLDGPSERECIGHVCGSACLDGQQLDSQLFCTRLDRP